MCPHTKFKNGEDILLGFQTTAAQIRAFLAICLLYTSDAADDLLCVDLGGRRIIKKIVIFHEQIAWLSLNFVQIIPKHSAIPDRCSTS